MKVWEVKFSRSGDFEKAARAFDLTGVDSVFISIKKMLFRPQEWRLLLRFQCRQWENGDGKKFPSTFIFISDAGEQGWQLEGV